MAMKRSERAKIFAPFSPLNNFYEALKKKERVITPKSELAPERIEELDFILRTLSVSDMVEIIYYNNGVYEKIVGCVAMIDAIEKSITIAKTKVFFDDIYDLKAL